ncbi:MAG: 30S ribosomal protein S8 [Verrucomicrobia bacterium]|nr:30S ribosomal protein S8 [Verrucomicrobiota bacterium]
MSLSDPIADLLVRILNGGRAGHRYVEVNDSKMRMGIVQMLKELGFVEGFLRQKEEKKAGKIRVYLKYGKRRQPVIHGLRRISKPGCRKYVGHSEIPTVLGGMGEAILSTPQGLLSGQEARKVKVGGELLCYVW